MKIFLKFKEFIKGLLIKFKEWEETATKREKILLLLICIIIPLFLHYKFYINPTLNKINSLKNEIENIEKEISFYKNVSKKYEKLKKIIKEREDFLNEIKKILPDEREIPLLLKNIAQIAKNSGLEILLFKPGKEIEKDYYEIIPLTMKIEGQYKNILVFFNRIESMERLVVLESIAFQPDFKKQKLVVTVNFQTFKYTGKKLQKDYKK